MKRSRQNLLSSLAFIAVILTVTATGALAQPSDQPAESRGVGVVSPADAHEGRHIVEFLKECGEGEACPDTSIPVPEIGNEGSLSSALQDSAIIIAKNAEPADGTDFAFSSDLGGFTLDDASPDDGDAYGDSKLFTVTPSVSQSFIEQPSQFWDLNSIVCVYSSVETVVVAIRENGKVLGVTVSLAPEDEITCAFSNQKGPVNSVDLPSVSKNYLSP